MAEISNSSSNTVVNGTSGNDTINNVGFNPLSNVTIVSGNGDDYISNYGYGRNNANVTIDAGNGNDFIRNGIESSTSDDTSINGGAGNDTIYNSGERVTINAGTGNNIITLESYAVNSIIEYSNDDGNNTIYGFNSDDTLKITGGTYSTTKSGNDLILTVGSGNITLKDSADKQLHINNDVLNPNGSLFIYNQNNNTVLSGSDNGDSIYSFDQSNVTVNSGAGKDHIENYGSNILNNADDGDDYIYIRSGDYVTVNAGAGEDTISNSASVAAISGDNGNDSIRNDSSNVTINGGAGSDSIINSGSDVYISGGDGNDSITNFYIRSNLMFSNTLSGSNTTINGGKGNDTLSGGENADVFLYADDGGNDVITNYSSNDTIRITSGSYSTQTSGSDVLVKVGTGTITLQGAKGTTLNIVGTKATSSGGDSSNSTLKTVTDSDSSLVTVDSKVKVINASSRSKAVKIMGNSLANSIVGGNGADSLNGGSGADTLNGGKGNDTLTGGAGSDVFIYASGDGNDLIADYAAGDKLKITGAKISKASVSGSNVVLTVGSGKVTLKGAKGKTLSIYNNSTSLTSTVIGGSSSSSTLKTITDSDSSPVTVDSAVKLINASSRTKAIKITGNTLANTIRGGSGVDTIYGGSGNDSILGNNGNDKLYGDAGVDTLIGGKGSDTLTGGGGRDVFIYSTGDGNDVITDYTAGQDKIKLTSGSISSSSLNGSDVVLKIGTGSIKVKNAKDKSITVVDSAGKSTSQVYGTSSNNYEERWFIEHNNFSTDEISSILQDTTVDSNALGKVTTYDASTILTGKQPSMITYNQNKK